MSSNFVDGERKMKPQDRIVTFPLMGKKNSKIIKDFLESLDLKVIMPPLTTDETIKKGVKHTAGMICYPLKQTLGNYMEALDKGANTLLAYDTIGLCRFRMYNQLHEFTLTGLGYDFDIVVMNPGNLVSKLKEVSGKNKITILRKLYSSYKKLKESNLQQWSEDKPNIGLIGEVFCLNDEYANQNLKGKIRHYGCNSFNTVTQLDFMHTTIPLFNLWGLKDLFKKDELKKYKERAKKYMNGWRSGHAYENLYNLMWLIDKKVDGIISVAPLSCCPEVTIEPYVDKICKDSKIPLLRIGIDENQSPANFETRLETFCEILKMRYKK